MLWQHIVNRHHRSIQSRQNEKTAQKRKYYVQLAGFKNTELKVHNKWLGGFSLCMCTNLYSVLVIIDKKKIKQHIWVCT